MKKHPNNNSYSPKPLPPEVQEALDQESAKLAHELERVWDLTGIALKLEAASTEDEANEMWARIRSGIEEETSLRSDETLSRRFNPDRLPRHSSKKRRSTVRIWQYAAAFAVTCILFFAGYWFIPESFTADPGQIAEIVLPDKSVVILNSGSTLSYKRGFDGIPFIAASQRIVHLEGEAYFDVAHAGTPFTVETFNASISVLGTEFNIRAWSDEPELESTVTLVSGKVAVSSYEAPHRHVTLEEPGQTTVVRTSLNDPIAPTLESLDNILSWRNRGLALESKTLDTIFSELERRYDVSITMEDEQILRDSLTLLMPNPSESIESILSDICIKKNLKFRKTSRGYVIYQPDSR